jgi:hypothetical protein
MIHKYQHPDIDKNPNMDRLMLIMGIDYIGFTIGQLIKVE